LNKIFKLLAPQSLVGVTVVCAVMLCFVTAMNLGFILVADGMFVRPVSFYAVQAIVVGAPFVAAFTTITTYQLRLQRHLSLLSRKDGLTGLNNRHTFLQLAQKRLDGGSVGVLILLDADHVKRINDKWGHALAIAVCLRFPTGLSGICAHAMSPAASVERNSSFCCRARHCMKRASLGGGSVSRSHFVPSIMARTYL
tara:strand:+ start:1816 stop:2406 length:591 start_codon:yes stop_codon:yes gene_type:complete